MVLKGIQEFCPPPNAMVPYPILKPDVVSETWPHAWAPPSLGRWGSGTQWESRGHPLLPRGRGSLPECSELQTPLHMRSGRKGYLPKTASPLKNGAIALTQTHLLPAPSLARLGVVHGCGFCSGLQGEAQVHQRLPIGELPSCNWGGAKQKKLDNHSLYAWVY